MKNYTYNLSRFIAVALIAILNLTSKTVYAQESGLYDMTLEELMNMQVTSASKKAEDMFDAPSVITTISSQEISDFGGRNVYEVLERSASFYGLSSYFFPLNTVGLRGDLPTHINPNILFLIDGRPVRESIKGGQQIEFLTTYPLNVIQQIEIIRGPGSVLYGSNAYIGVVNIITKKSNKPETIVDVNGGSMGTAKVDAAYVGSVGDLNITAGLNYYKTDGWEFSDSLFYAGSARYGQNNFDQNAYAGYLNLNYKKFTLSAFHGGNELGKLNHTGEAADYKASRTFVDFGYSDSLTNWYQIAANITYNGINDVFWVDAPDGVAYEVKSNDMVYELTNFFTISDNINLIVGGSVSVLKGEQYYGDNHILGGQPVPYPVEPYTTVWYNAYFQGDYTPTDWFKLVLGGQINKVPSADLDFVPRIATIFRAKNGLGTKLMYGQAFRAPYAGETDLTIFPVSGNPDLMPQKIGTFEAQAFYSKEKGNIAFTYFNSSQSDLISRKSNTDPNIPSGTVYTNAGELDSWGLELEGRWIVNNDFYLTGSYSYQTNENSDGKENSKLLPNHMLKLGASYDFKEYVKLSVFNQYYSSPYNFSEVYDTNDRNRTGEGELTSFNWLTAKAKINMNTIFNFDKRQISLTAEGVNLLDKTVYNPEIVFNGFDGIQTRPGRAFYFGAQINF